MELNLGHTSAKRQSWHENSMRELVIRLKDEFPSADRNELTTRFAQRALNDDEYLNAAIDHAMNNTLNALEREDRAAASRRAPEVRAKAAAATKETVESVKEQIMLLKQPNGKRLRYCTREDIAKWGKGYDRMAKKMKPRQMVGQAFSEEQVRGMLK